MKNEGKNGYFRLFQLVPILFCKKSRLESILQKTETNTSRIKNQDLTKSQFLLFFLLIFKFDFYKPYIPFSPNLNVDKGP